MDQPLYNVVNFHLAYSCPVPIKPEFPAQDRIDLRIKLMEEELNEVKEAIEKKDLVNLAKELADLIYVVNGTIIEFGLTTRMAKVHAAVHDSNMSKLDATGKPIYKPNGKVAKGPFYFEPDIESILNDN